MLINAATAPIVGYSAPLWMYVVIIAIPLLLLEIYLSKKVNKWYGVFIPALSFCVATTYAILIGHIIFFVIFNIPAVIFTIIYAACRENLKRKKATLSRIKTEELE